MKQPVFLQDAFLHAFDRLRLASIVSGLTLKAVKGLADGFRETISEWPADEKLAYNTRFLGFHLGRPGMLEQEQYLRDNILPRYVTESSVVQLATIVEGLLVNLVAAGHVARGIENVQLDSKVERTMQQGFSRQIEIIRPVVELPSLPSFSRYREVRATRNVIVHSHGFATERYVNESLGFARAAVDDWLAVDQEYVLQAWTTTHSFINEMYESLYLTDKDHLGE